MRFEWDEPKRQRLIEERGIDILDAALIFERPVIEAFDDREGYGEARIQALGMADGVAYVVVYTWRGDARRLITAWKAGRDGQREYQKRIAQADPSDEGKG